MPRFLQKITRNGNSSAVTIPRPLMFHCNFFPGDSVVLEVLENLDVLVRKPRPEDFQPRHTPRILDDAPTPVKA